MPEPATNERGWPAYEGCEICQGAGLLRLLLDEAHDQVIPCPRCAHRGGVAFVRLPPVEPAAPRRPLSAEEDAQIQAAFLALFNDPEAPDAG